MSTHSSAKRPRARFLSPQEIAAGDDNRREPRRNLSKTVEILPSKKPKEDWNFIVGEIKDCSRRGVGLILPSPLEPGEEFLAKLTAGDTVTMLTYTVRNCTELPDHRYRIGAELTNPDNGDMQSLADLLPPEDENS